VRTTVFADAAATLDRTRPVCYVLEDRHLSNLALLFAETAAAGLPRATAPLSLGEARGRRAFFFLNRGGGAPSSLLSALVREVAGDPLADVQLVPVLILWGRGPAKQDSILKALFAETWRVPGAFRQFFAVLLHGRQTLLRFSAPLSLRELVHGGGAPLAEATALRKVSRVLRVHFRRQREAAIGPDLSHRNTQIDAVLGNARVRAAIAAEAERAQLSPDAAAARARACALEIASDYSYGVVRALEIFLDWLWEHLYDGVAVHNIEALTRLAPGQSIVYVPCHRSHIDYLLLSWLVHRHGLSPPHVAAGANLDLPLVGALLRRGGAFFLRRSFKGDPLYAAVFAAYLQLMLARGFAIEYFIEGGRSRSGRTLAPKAGILGMTVHSFVRHHARPLLFVPVYIGYERLIEGASYVGELAGRPKQAESLWQLAKAARRVRRVFGTVHVNFGEALPLADFLDAGHPGWRQAATGDEADGDDAELRRLIRAAALTLAQRINAAAVLTPVSLAALALLATPRATADARSLARSIAHLQAIDAAAPYSAQRIACPLAPEEAIATTLRLGFVERIAHPLGDLLRVPDAQLPLLAYFRNNVLHLFALPALVACVLGNVREIGRGALAETIAGMLPLVAAELFLHWDEATLPQAFADVVAVLAERGLLRRDGAGIAEAVDVDATDSVDAVGNRGERLRAPEAGSLEAAELQLIGEALRPTLARQFLLLALLDERGSGALTRQQLEADCHLLAQRLTLLGGLPASETGERAVFAMLLGKLLDGELLRADYAGRLHFDQPFTQPLAYAELVLPAEVRLTVRRMARAHSRELAEGTGAG